MKRKKLESYITGLRFKVLFVVMLFTTVTFNAQVTLEEEVHITDLAMFFDGVQVGSSASNSTTGYDYRYGNALSPHGDCVKAYKHYVFMTWYRGGKNDRHVMLTRYNTLTGAKKTIEFPHQHTGLAGKWWIGETHNTIAIGISPLNGTIHMVYDMHAYGNSGAFVNDYFRYSYSVADAAELPDEEFTLDKFVPDPIDGDYRHCTMDGVRDPEHYSKYTYPTFFLNDEGDLFLTMRKGTSHDGAQAFIRYDASASTWGRFQLINALGAGSKGETNNWSIYGNVKYVDGKIRIGFQRRLNTGSDKYRFQNGVYYAYSDDPTGATDWKNHEGVAMTMPLVKAEEVLVYEPGDYVETTLQNQVHIVSGFDWTVTDNGDVHIISRVRDDENGVTKNIHSYKPAGANNFIITTDFPGASALYAAGNDVFIIGLNSSGRPFVERAPGGTNFFTKVYEATEGRRFQKGEIHISEGKLYYYLLENHATDKDDTRPTYLQIIDLDVSTEPEPFGVSLLAPADESVYDEGEAIDIFARATTDMGTIAKVDIMINGALHETLTEAPYVLSWTPQVVGTYTIEAIAYDDNEQNITSETHSIEILEVDPTDLTRDVYRLKNVATGDYLTSNETVLEASDSGNGQDKEWTFVKTDVEGDYYNIDSQSNRGILRFVASSAEGQMIVTGFAAPRPDGDKIWNIIYNEAEENYTFEARDLGRYLYQNEADEIVHSDATDTRSKWIAESTSQTLSTTDQNLEIAGITVYPNPTNGDFTLEFGKLKNVKIEIYSILGKKVYENETQTSNLNVENNQRFTSGVYLIKAVADGNTTYHTKLVIK